jgi:hypothetical protein
VRASDFPGDRARHSGDEAGEWRKAMGTVLLVVLVLMLVGVIPTWPHSRDWGYLPSGGLGVVLLIVLLLVLSGRL